MWMTALAIILLIVGIRAMAESVVAKRDGDRVFWSRWRGYFGAVCVAAFVGMITFVSWH